MGNGEKTKATRLVLLGSCVPDSNLIWKSGNQELRTDWNTEVTKSTEGQIKRMGNGEQTKAKRLVRPEFLRSTFTTATSRYDRGCRVAGGTP